MTGLEHEIFEQPQALHRTLDNLAPTLPTFTAFANQIERGDIRRVVFTGMGASYGAAYPAMLYCIQRGIDVSLIEAADLLYEQQSVLRSGTLLVAISQSGASVEVRRIAERYKAQIPIIGITNEADSPLARDADLTLLLSAGPERTVSNKTYTCTIAALNLMVRILAREPVAPMLRAHRQIADAIATRLASWAEQATALAQQLSEMNYIVYLGRGTSYASAYTGALITKESAKMPTEPMSAASFRHGPIEVMNPGVAAVLFAGAGDTRMLTMRLAADLTVLGGDVVIVGSGETPVTSFRIELPTDDMWLLPLAEIVPIQLFALRLAELRGHNPDQFRFIGKVATEE